MLLGRVLARRLCAGGAAGSRWAGGAGPALARIMRMEIGIARDRQSAKWDNHMGLTKTVLYPLNFNWKLRAELARAFPLEEDWGVDRKLD